MIIMEYLAYDFNSTDTFEDTAAFFGTTVTDLLRVNNLSSPPPVYIKDEPSLVDENGNFKTLLIPNPDTKYIHDGVDTTKSNISNVRLIGDDRGGLGRIVGFASQNKCFLVVEGVGMAVFPGYPDGYSDSHQASVSSQTPLGRSEPFQIYQNSGPRTVNVSFKMDREMTRTTEIGDIVGIVQSACYPVQRNATIIPRCTLVIGNNCSITGIITSVNTNWSDTIIADQFMVVTLDFSIQECTGNPKTAGVVRGLRGV